MPLADHRPCHGLIACSLLARLRRDPRPARKALGSAHRARGRRQHALGVASPRPSGLTFGAISRPRSSGGTRMSRHLDDPNRCCRSKSGAKLSASRSTSVAYVITEPCIGTKDTSCVDVCPVDCVHGDKEDPMLYIDPVVCIDCGACVSACPVERASPRRTFLNFGNRTSKSMWPSTARRRRRRLQNRYHLQHRWRPIVARSIAPVAPH